MRELRRAEVLGRVKGQALRLVDAAKMLELSYRQAKRLWRRYREEGAKGLQHRSAGRSSNRAKPEKFRRAESERGDAAALDVGGGVVEPHAKTESAPEAPGTTATLWRLGADGWEFPCVV
jgi:transposase